MNTTFYTTLQFIFYLNGKKHVGWNLWIVFRSVAANFPNWGYKLLMKKITLYGNDHMIRLSQNGPLAYYPLKRNLTSCKAIFYLLSFLELSYITYIGLLLVVSWNPPSTNNSWPRNITGYDLGIRTADLIKYRTADLKI